MAGATLVTDSLQPTSEGLHLVYQYFQVQPRPEQDFDETQAAQRQSEYEECLERNLQHRHVEGVHILLERAEEGGLLSRTTNSLAPSVQRKLHVLHLGRRMRYSDAFQYANAWLAGKIVVVLNADIFLGDWAPAVARAVIECRETRDQLFRNRCWGLTRHEKSKCLGWDERETGGRTEKHNEETPCGCPFLRGKKRYFGSHDSFWFLAPLRTSVVDQCQHVQNRWGAEHKVINALLSHGYEVINPSRSIRTYHNHASDVHPWRKEPGGHDILADPRDHPPLPPTFLEEVSGKSRVSMKP